MKEKKRENQKLMQDIAAENKQLLEPLHVAVRQVEELRRDLKDYEKDKLSLKYSFESDISLDKTVLCFKL